MERLVSSSSSRKLLIASLVFGVFVLCDFALFGWLIFRSLSQREVERVLLETRSEAEKLAQQMSAGDQAAAEERANQWRQQHAPE